ncbi:MAG TPA: beta-1,6-N-acetylglucosaminyltransferase [Vicinamibacterales bacterium]|nr:beta-1,6-N-acetylglucosaminyltransferase [Vicinamibacterales bacterium]HOQ59348.1 beta-1,6-N-acetylglucosaminyltransferase [Vicinamibacterales bacterium]HPK71926.1 beta-1,6-N-acetylglucosaminyltransferase [Vicinamibacterales bacterium]
MKKHAFLIIAHQDPVLLQQLVSLLDDERNGIYLLVDSKSGLRVDGLAPTRASLTLLPPAPVWWGGVSTICAELSLLRAAAAHRYHYYHLLSGADLPLVSQDCLHARLADTDFEYVEFHEGARDFARWKVAYYHLLVETAPYRAWWAYRMVGRALIRLQALAGIDRTRGSRTCFHHGSAFFSITHDLALYVLARERWVRERFRHTVTCDEVFLQTLAMRSPFRGKLAGEHGIKPANLRLIDWATKRRHRNSPYVFRMPDYARLRDASETCLFARKFSRAVDAKIVDFVVHELRTRGSL